MKKLFLLLFVFLLSFSGCANLTDGTSVSGNSNSDKKNIVCGEINFSGAVPSEMVNMLLDARNAVPGLSGTYTCYVEAITTGKDPVTANAVKASGETKYSFNLGLSDGKWKITAYLKEGTNIILKTDSITYTIPQSQNLSLMLKPVLEGTGSVNLQMNDNASGAQKARILLSDETQKNNWSTGSNQLQNEINLTDHIIAQNIPCGAYDLTINFYDTNSILIYSTTQTINVFNNLVTNTWVSGTTASGGIIDGNAFTLTSALTAAFTRNTFYVNETTGNDNNSGSPYSPVKTVSKAVKLASESSENVTKNIYVKAGGIETVSSKIDFLKDINVEVYTDVLGDKQGQYKLIRIDNAEFNISMLMIGEGKNVSLSGFIISGNNQEVPIDGACINNMGNLTLSNINVINCPKKDSYKGRGVYNNKTETSKPILNLKGDIQIENELYLPAESIIKIKGELSENSKIKVLSGVTTLGTTNKILEIASGSSLSELDWQTCNKFEILNNNTWCVKPNGTNGVLALKGANAVADYSPIYTLSLNINEKEPGVEAEITLSIKDSANNDITPASYSLKLYQNGEAITSIESISESMTAPAWLPEGSYTIKAEAVIGGIKHDGEFVFFVGVAPIALLTAAPTAATCPNVSMNKPTELTKIKTWIEEGSDFEGVTITLSDNVDATSLTDWTPIGSLEKPFKGTFDGNGKSITFNISRDSTKEQIATLLYKNEGIIENLIVEKYSSGKLGKDSSRGDNAGGGICCDNLGIIRNCIVNADIELDTRANLGGICAYNYGTVINCMYTGTLKETFCINWGDVTQENGGIAGIMQSTADSNADLKIVNCICTGDIQCNGYENVDSGPNGASGGIVGHIYKSEAVVTNCFWKKNNVYDKSSSKYLNALVYKNKSNQTNPNRICNPNPSNITGCGYFDTITGDVTAGDTDSCGSAQILNYSGSAVDRLNAYVDAHPEEKLKKWKINPENKLTLDFNN